MHAVGPRLEPRELLPDPGVAPLPHRLPDAAPMSRPAVFLDQQLDPHQPLSCSAILKGHYGQANRRATTALSPIAQGSHRSSTARTRRVSASAVNGFCRKPTPTVN